MQEDTELSKNNLQKIKTQLSFRIRNVKTTVQMKQNYQKNK